MNLPSRWTRRFAIAVAVLLGGLASLPGRADVFSRQRLYTPEEAVQAVSGTLRAQALEGDSGQGLEPEEKSLANGLYMTGNFTYSYAGSSITLSVSQINNDSYSRTSGTLRLEFWATTVKPSRGQGFTGYKLATSSTLNPLPPRTYYSSVTRTTTFVPPPDGTYWLVMVLSEYSSSDCASNNHYCLTDSFIFSTQRTWGTPSSTVTVIANSAGLCVENVPGSVASSLQASQPGVWSTYPASTSCASLGMPFYAGTFPDFAELRVYTSSSATAQQLCASGLVVNCTVYPSPSADYTDLWWNSSESGWGVSFTQHASGIAFVAWYTYDASGNPKWYVASSCRVIGSGCTGTLYETTGPPFGPTFNPSQVAVREVGNITFSFSNASSGTMSYTLNGVPGHKSISRQPF